MFVSVVCDLGNEDSMKVVTNLLLRYSFRQMQRNVFESASITERNLSRLKRDIDRATDYYDTVRFYQFPVDECLSITSLSEKRWKRTVVKKSDTLKQKTAPRKKTGGSPNAVRN